MTALTVALVTLALVFGGALLGMYLRNALSEDHLREDVRDVVKLSTGLIGTMAALVLGLLIASAKSSYDTKSTEIKQITANIILVDLELEQYGPDAQNLRTALRKWRQQNLSKNSGNSSRTTIHSAPFKRNC